MVKPPTVIADCLYVPSYLLSICFMYYETHVLCLVHIHLEFLCLSGGLILLSLYNVHFIDPLEKEMATHSSILAWEIPWTEESGML